MIPPRALEKLRAICLALPGADEVERWGHPNWRTGGKIFAALEEYKGVLSICFKVGVKHQAIFRNDPRFYKTPYVGKHGWVSLKAEGKLDWREIAALVKQSHGLIFGPRVNANKRDRVSPPLRSPQWPGLLRKRSHTTYGGYLSEGDTLLNANEKPQALFASTRVHSRPKSCSSRQA